MNGPTITAPARVSNDTQWVLNIASAMRRAGLSYRGSSSPRRRAARIGALTERAGIASSCSVREPFLYHISAFFIAGFLFLGMATIWEVFYRLGAKNRPRAKARLDGEALSLGSIDTAVGGLLALILAFSFSMAAERFDMREEVIVKEANALGTAFFRCSFLMPEEQSGCRRDLARYGRLRVQFFEAGHDLGRLQEVIEKSEDLHHAIWDRVERSVPQRDTPSVAQLIVSLNELFDLNTDRVAAERRVVPQEITVITIALCFAWSAFAGYAFGLTSNRQFGAWLAFAAFVTLVVLTTLDLDRPGRGFIRPTRGNSVMEDVAKQLEAESVAP